MSFAAYQTVELQGTYEQVANAGLEGLSQEGKTLHLAASQKVEPHRRQSENSLVRRPSRTGASLTKHWPEGTDEQAPVYQASPAA
ncbi:hypothetical protein HII31_08799 [Pseudocercospora fuligena]|uniref:Uncharacterized protein n=1 Tax=Pseudocercospora fuligena TaxID=685502 RepID=A0A8H6RFV4_9PEZI|nr:hypothetical protein HII31_08799 [Pseudocercospora fuligena]